MLPCWLLALSVALAGAGAGPERRDRAEVAQAAWEAAPQDYALAVAAAQAWDVAGVPERAVGAWRVAVTLSSGNPAARRGQAWSLLRGWQPRAARLDFRALVDEDDDSDARLGLRLATATGRPWSLDVTTTWGVAPSLDTLRQTWSLHGTASWHGDDGGLLRLGYRYGRSDYDGDLLVAYGLADGAELTSGVYSDASHQVAATAGYDVRRWGLSARGLLTVDGGGGREPAGHAVLAGRLGLVGDLSLALSYGQWPDSHVAGGELGWALPVGRWLSLTPSISGQLVFAGEAFRPLGVASLAVAAGDHRVWGWAGGRYGRAFRPLLPSPMMVVDLPGDLSWGAWAGLGASPVGSVRFDVGYTLDALETTAGEHLLHGIVVRVGVGP